MPSLLGSAELGSPESYVETLAPRAQNVTVFGDGTFIEGIKVKQGQWALI